MNCFFSSAVLKNLTSENAGIRSAVLIHSESSELMHRLLSSCVARAERNGLSCHKFLSKYDYDKLCAVYIKNRKAFIGDKAIIPDLHEFSTVKIIDADEIYESTLDKSVVGKINSQRKLYISEAEKYESSAAVISRESAKMLFQFVDKAKILNYILRFMQRKGLRQASKDGLESTFTLGSITSWGVHTCFESVAEKCSDVYSICDCTRNIASLLINGFSSAFRQCGKDTEKFTCSLCPEFSEHLCIPELSLAFVCENDYHPYRYSDSGEISQARFLKRNIPHCLTEKLTCNEELKDELISSAVFSLYDAMERDNELCRYLQAFENAEKYEVLNKEIENLCFE